MTASAVQGHAASLEQTRHEVAPAELAAQHRLLRAVPADAGREALGVPLVVKPRGEEVMRPL
jgi:hypothetical protein